MNDQFTPFPTPTTFTMDNLVSIMENLRFLEPNLLADKHVTPLMCETAFAVLVKDVLGVLEALRGLPAMAGRCMDDVFNHMLVAIRTPYLLEIERLETANRTLENGLVREQTELLREQTEHRTLKSEHRTSKSEILRVKKKYQTYKTSSKSELRAANKQHYKDLVQLNSTIITYVSDKQKMLRERALGYGVDSIPGSVNRAQTWAKVVSKNPGMQELDYPLLPHVAFINDKMVRDLKNTKFEKEQEMYEPTFACLRAHLAIADKDGHTGCILWDTHARKNLEGHSPDLTLSVVNTKRPDAGSAIAVWELKVGALDEDGHGQIYDYLKIISKKQGHRSHFFGVLSNLKENILITLIREKRIANHGENDWKWSCRSFKPMTLPSAIAFVQNILIHQREYLPSMPAFSRELGPMELRLGSTTSSVVAAFRVPDYVRTKSFARTRWVNQELITSDTMETFVVKRCVPAHGLISERSIKSEIKILARLHKADVHPNLPQMVYYANDFQEVAIRPWGYPVKPGDNLMNWRQLLKGVFEALKWLHGLKIIHRDVRWDNIVSYHDRAVLIDLGASVYVPDDERNTIYGGGNICCPPAIIGNFNKGYHPRPADDWYAFILLVNTLNWPERWKNLRTQDVAEQNSEVAIKLKAFWEQMATSKVWSCYVDAAEAANEEVLEGLLDFCVYFGGPGKKEQSSSSGLL